MGVHKAIRKALRRYVGRLLADLKDRWDKSELWAMIEKALAEAYSEKLVRAAWADTCLDTLDPTPLVEEVEKRLAQVKAAKQRSDDARARLREAKEEAGSDGKQESGDAAAGAAAMDEVDDLFPIQELPPPPPPRNTKYFPDGAVLNSEADYNRLQRWEEKRKSRKRPRDEDADEPQARARKRREMESDSDEDIDAVLESDDDSDEKVPDEPASSDWDDVCGQCQGPVEESKDPVLCSECLAQLCSACRGASGAGTRSRPAAIVCLPCRNRRTLPAAARPRSPR